MVNECMELWCLKGSCKKGKVLKRLGPSSPSKLGMALSVSLLPLPLKLIFKQQLTCDIK